MAMKNKACLVLLASFFASPALFAQDVRIYNDVALEAGWQDWSWATHELNSTTQVFSGTTSIRFEPDNWEGIFFHSTTQRTQETHDRLRFRIHGGAGGGQLITAALQLGGTNLGSASLAAYLPGGNLPANSWTTVTIPLSAIGAPGATFYDGVVLQAGTGNNQAPVWVDLVELLVNPNPPEPPGPVAIAVNPSLDRRPIDPRVYGVNFGEVALHNDLRWPVRRWGGNSTSRYNWRIDVHNTANDYFFQNIVAPDPGTLPHGSSTDVFIDQTFAGGGEPIITVPTIGFTPREDGRIKRWGFSQATYGAQSMDECRFYAPNPPNWCSADSGNGRCNGVANPHPTFCQNGQITGNNPADTSIVIGPTFVTQWMDHIASRVGGAGEGGVRLFALDNEAMLWNSTHRDVFPSPLTYDGLWSRTVSYASAMKAADSQAQILGPVTWGWCDLFTSASDAAAGPSCVTGPDRQNHGGLALVPWYLQQVCAYQAQHGVRLVDYLDVHYYPQGGVDGLDASNPGEDPATSAKRLRSLRELYDPAWVAESWIGEPVYLIPRLRAWIDQYCPGTKLAVTEYSWGADDGPSGALAQAEVMAIFGREGVDLATRWVAPEPNTRTVDAFRLYLDYDGSGGRVGGTSVRATSSDIEDVTAYAAEEGAILRVLLFNHDIVARQANVAVSSLSGSGTLYRFTAASPLATIGPVSTNAGGFSVELPARSASLVVLPIGLFADGFETGNTSRWSLAVP
jgi:hypothetical protein